MFIFYSNSRGNVRCHALCDHLNVGLSNYIEVVLLTQTVHVILKNKDCSIFQPLYSFKLFHWRRNEVCFPELLPSITQVPKDVCTVHNHELELVS